MALAASPATAADIAVSKSAATTLTATDNLDLDPDGEKDAALIWTQTGTFGVRGDGARLDLNLDYGANFDTIYSDGATDFEVRQTLLGTSTTEAIEDWVFIDVGASISQQLIENTGAVGSESSVGDSETADVYTLTVSPYVQRRLGRWAQAEARYRHRQLIASGGNNSVGDTVTNAQSITVSTGPRFSRVRLTQLLEHEDVQSDADTGDSERYTAETRGEYAWSRTITLLGLVGYESIESDSDEDDPKGVIWNVGFRATPGPRTEIEFTYGERFDEPNFGGSLEYLITPRLTVRARYDETFDTSQQRLNNRIDRVAVDENGDLIDDNTGAPIDPNDPGLGLDDNSSLTRRFSSTLIGRYDRDSMQLTTSVETRDFETQADEEAYAVTGRWDRDFSSTTSGSALASYRLIDDEDSARTDTVIGRLEVSHNLYDNWSAIMALSRAQRFSDDDDEEYTENAISLGLRVRF